MASSTAAYVAGSRSANEGSGLAPSELALLTSRSASAELAGGDREGGPVGGVGDVAGHRAVRAAGQAGRGFSRAVRVAGVHDQPPAAGGELGGEGAAEAAGGAGDDGDRHRDLS